MDHPYGIAVLFLLISLGKKIILSRRFVAEKACELVYDHQVEVITAVPLMVHKMLRNNPDALKSLACIASGGAKLNPKLIDETFHKLGSVLYNLYGTSETGLNMIATPKDLQYSPATIGKKISGVRLHILGQHHQEVEIGRVGQLCMKRKHFGSAWIKTGDLGYRDHQGYYFLCGRVDDMIVSAGENVYPSDVEQILITHPMVEDAAVIGIHDEIFGQRLKAFVLPVKDADITADALYQWLRTKAARFQMPKEIVFIDSIPYTPLGKPDKRQLLEKN